LYTRKCDATGKNVISNYSLDKQIKVYNQDFWWSDSWDAMKYGLDIDLSKSFFEQMNNLRSKVPTIALWMASNVNSEYVNWV
jgi:hypothetical protein